jgi:hypothetical protein
MLRRIPVDTHEQRIGIMSTTQTFFAHRQPTTSVSATKAFPQGLRPPAIAKWVAKTAGTVEMGLRCLRMSDCQAASLRLEQGAWRFRLADGVGFEPTVRLHARRFSRPVP